MTAGRVFISYSQDSPEHMQRVLDLAKRLRASGVDAWIDRYSPPPPEGWALWMEREFEEAQWIILICTDRYRRRFDQKEASGGGVAMEAVLVREYVRRAGGKNHRFIPLVFTSDDATHIPTLLGNASRYIVPDDYEKLLCHLEGKPEVEPPPLGDAAPAVASEPAPLPAGVVQSAGVPDEPEVADADRSGRSRRGRARRILIVAANPGDGARLALGREIREITLALRRGGPARYELRVLWAATESDVRKGMLSFAPDILHFCGHGSRDGIHLEQDGHPDWGTYSDGLVHWIRAALAGQPRLELAVLNFCHSQEMLSTLADFADVVIGPTVEVADVDAIRFSSAFYMGLASGCPGVFAYHLGCSAIDLCEAGTTAGDVYGIRSRTSQDTTPTGAATAPARHTLAFIASEPSIGPRLRLDRELRAILGALPVVKPPHVEQRWATRPRDFLQALVEVRPSIVHLTGHGFMDGGFVFETDTGEPLVSAGPALARTLSLFHGCIRCAVLMFNYSSVVAARLAGVLDFVVSVSHEVPDDTCRIFAERFYEMVGARRSIPNSFQAAVAALRSSGDAELFSLQGRGLRSG